MIIHTNKQTEIITHLTCAIICLGGPVDEHFIAPEEVRIEFFNKFIFLAINFFLCLFTINSKVLLIHSNNF